MVEEIVGGRLLLKYDGSDDDVEKPWIHYDSPRLCGFGFVTNKGTPWQLQYPGKVNKFTCKSKLGAQLRLCAAESIKNPTPADLFEPKTNMKSHTFIKAMKLEALYPGDMKSVRPATVVKVFNRYHFLVVLDDHLNDYEDTKMGWLCDVMHPYIYPINWAARNSMPFTVPKIWNTSNEFDWEEYLTQTSSVPAPEYCFGIKRGIGDIAVNMNLEVVHPCNSNEVHAAIILRILENMIEISLFSTGEKIWYADISDQIFPIGWCNGNSYPLQIAQERKQTPKEVKIDRSSVKEDPLQIAQERKQTPKEVKIDRSSVKEDILKEEACDRIYFNYKCYAGPLIDRYKLSLLPKHVGPGPLSWVMKYVLNLMISASNDPANVLRVWESDGVLEPGMRLETLKAKSETSTCYSQVQVATTHDQVANFCREMCGKIKACPCLVGPVEYAAQCPEKCELVNECNFQNSGDRHGRVRAKRLQNFNLMTVRFQERRAARKSEMKEGHWNKTELKATCVKSYNQTKLYPGLSVDSEHKSSQSTNYKNNDITDVSGNEKSELKKPTFSNQDPQTSGNKPLKRMRPAASWCVKLNLPENPALWTIQHVHDYLRSTEDCKLIADKLREEEVDGPAFLMMNLPMMLKFLHMRKEHALLLYKHIIELQVYHVLNFQE